MRQQLTQILGFDEKLPSEFLYISSKVDDDDDRSNEWWFSGVGSAGFPQGSYNVLKESVQVSYVSEEWRCVWKSSKAAAFSEIGRLSHLWQQMLGKELLVAACMYVYGGIWRDTGRLAHSHCMCMGSFILLVRTN